MHFALYRQEYIGGIALHFSAWCIPVGAWKFRFQIWGSFHPKILEPQNFYFNFEILRLYYKCLEIVSSCRKSDNGVAICNISLRLWPRWTLVHKRWKIAPEFWPNIFVLEKLIAEQAWIALKFHTSKRRSNAHKCTPTRERYPQRIWRPKTSIFWRNFWQLQLRDVIANISGTPQDIFDQKTVLQTLIIPGGICTKFGKLCHAF